ncbi:IS3 family transposase [Spiroplasma gladiatoris]|uniref:IS3 family transposase n=1 Tax=Spiroplasma gladiatoris TaxID=2143 RepID=A0A4P7AGT8_9MOLU|nr:IS3 family transposase [Spiroplasma gladiatoris]
MITLLLNKYFNQNLKPWVVYRYMKFNNLKAVWKKECQNMTNLALRYENLLNRNFNSDCLNQKWVTDVTYIKIASGNA